MFVRLDLAAEPGEIVASIASAGHPRALIVRADGRIVQSPAHGILLGVLDFPIEALHVVSGEQKRWARVQVLETVIQRIEEGVERFEHPVPDSEGWA